MAAFESPGGMLLAEFSTAVIVGCAVASRAAKAIRPKIFSGFKRLFLNFAAANTGRADTHALGRSLDNRFHGLQIQIPAALGDVMGVADSISELWTPAAYFANS